MSRWGCIGQIAPGTSRSSLNTRSAPTASTPGRGSRRTRSATGRRTSRPACDRSLRPPDRSACALPTLAPAPAVPTTIPPDPDQEAVDGRPAACEGTPRRRFLHVRLGDAARAASSSASSPPSPCYWPRPSSSISSSSAETTESPTSGRRSTGSRRRCSRASRRSGVQTGVGQVIFYVVVVTGVGIVALATGAIATKLIEIIRRRDMGMGDSDEAPHRDLRVEPEGRGDPQGAPRRGGRGQASGGDPGEPGGEPDGRSAGHVHPREPQQRGRICTAPGSSGPTPRSSWPTRRIPRSAPTTSTRRRCCRRSPWSRSTRTCTRAWR